MSNGSILVGIFIGLLALAWEIMGILAKGPKLDTFSQMYWWVRNWVAEHTGKAGVYVMTAALAGFLGWLFWHFTFGGA